MFRVSQSSRRRVFRTGFLLVCVAPLIALAGWGWWLHRAGHVRTHEAALRRTLGMRVRIGQLLHPRPGVVRYHDLELADAETGRPIAKCLVAEVREPAGAGKPVELSIQGAAIAPGGTTPLFNLTEQLLRGEFRSEDLNVTLSADAIGFDKTSRFPQVKGASAMICSTETGAEARIVLRSVATVTTPQSAAYKFPSVAGIESAAEENKTVLRLVRNRRRGQHGEALDPADGFEIHTGAVAFPCEALAPLAGIDLAGLAGSRFEGSVLGSQEAAGWLVAVRGSLLDVDLNQLLGKRFGHVIEGKVNVKIDPARGVDGRLTEAVLTISGGPGRVSRSLLSAASDALHFMPRHLSTAPELIYPYKQLAAKVEINRLGGVFIDGLCEPTPLARNAVLLSPDGSALWMQPAEQPQPVSSLLRALVSGDGPTAPANSQIAWLLARLPMESTARRPQPVAPAPTTSAPPAATSQAFPPATSQTPPLAPLRRTPAERRPGPE